MGSLGLPLKAIDWLIFHLSVAEQEDCNENQGFLGVWHLLIINNLRLHLHEWCGMRWNTFLVINTISQANISVWEEFNATILSIIHSILLATQCYSKIMGFCSRRWWRSVWHITSLQSISLLFVEKCELLWIWLVNSSVVKLSISVIHVSLIMSNCYYANFMIVLCILLSIGLCDLNTYAVVVIIFRWRIIFYRLPLLYSSGTIDILWILSLSQTH